ncbi:MULTISPECIES: PfkB family carbohydrate kinase [unclassified Streptomyces]|uniref:carbohydrate kinase family protein n=1 Tax=unclassified Streptomyces TaxID=2593676 RepID=UPI00081DD0F1|nr:MULTISPECIES: PfkB family carbohydrate kinase [unclassified Streptomyces]MYR27229.1 sugar kinase [Streptomyces sp. SID4945]SCD81520.1 Sugar or nucleoside kinase, ribokinase family [Streptomyces sp. TverLS-915]SCF20122.1 Sugar or nucleoside kinase, ribokinase family [Streptomyces sp. LcepLS]
MSTDPYGTGPAAPRSEPPAAPPVTPRTEGPPGARVDPSAAPRIDPSAAPRIDPLAAIRDPAGPVCDVYLTGTVFLDIIFTGLDSAPVRGTESWARGMGSSPGGVANMATALARLGLRTSLAAAFGDDHYGEYCWDALAQGEGIDLTPSRRVAGWHSPVTVSMAYEGERTMVSHGHDAPIPAPAPENVPPARAAVASLAPGRPAPWIAHAAARGTRVFADVGWDESGLWDLAALGDLGHCEAFLPNAEEAMRYTRTSCPRAAAHALAEYVPLAVVTLGTEGAYAVDGRTGESAEVPAIRVPALDPTGAGDVFVAGFLTGSLAGWPLADRLAFAGLTAALSVQEFGGSLSAPGWAEVATWWRHVQAYDDQDPAALRRYAFLDALLPGAGTSAPWPRRRAVPTIGFRAGGGGAG